ncbi:MAG: HAD family hydrolase [bacterium]
MLAHLPRAMLIDLDDTILSAYPNPGPLWREVVSEFSPAFPGLEPATVTKAILASAETFWDDPERHRTWRQQMFPARREVVRLAFAEIAASGGPVVPADVTHAVADRFSTLREERYAPFPGAVEALEQLRDHGVALALITNGAGETQRAKLQRFDLERHFHHIQIEGEHGFGKPEERSYRHALAQLGAEPHEAWIVGDNLEWEVAAPQRIGMFAVWHDHAGTGLPDGSTVRPDRIIRALPELLEPASPPS